MNKGRDELMDEVQMLCREILGSKNELELQELKMRCMMLYERLVLLQHSSQVPTASEAQEPEQEVVLKDESPVGERPVEESPAEEPPVQKLTDSEAKDQTGESKEHPPQEVEYPTLSDLFVPTFDDIRMDMSQKEEFKDTVSLEETEKLFETKKEEPRQLSLNDRLVGKNIQVGLNDRIAFVNKLFNFSQSDFNKVLATLNTFETKEEAYHYMQYQVKTNYNWKGKEELEERFMTLIERKFMI